MKLTLLLTFLVAIQTCSCIDNVSNLAFTGTQMFYDISTYNFYLGRTFTYAQVIQARPGQQVHLYLFQNNYQQYQLTVYDGADATAPMLPIRAVNMPENRNEIEFPTPISSSGQNMYIVIQPDNTNPAANVDFQAMATDYVQPAGCSKMVINVNVADSPVAAYKLLSIPQGNCYYVFHANDPTNNPLLNQYFQPGFTDSQSITLFKGLNTDANHVLVPIQSFASDKYLVILPSATVDVSLAWTIAGSLNIPQTVGRYTHNALMTNDYYQDPYPNLDKQLTQTFSLQRYSPVTDIQLSYLKFMGSGTLTVTPYVNNQPTRGAATYHANQFTGPFNVTYSNVDRIELVYSTPDRNIDGGSGLYFLFDDTSVYKVEPSTTPRSTTRLPQTKSSENIFISTIALALTCFVHLI